jgi:hypothetical protein
MLEINHAWTSTGSSGGLEPVYLDFPPMTSVLMIQMSTIATTQSISFQTAQSSGGPWVNEATASVSTTASSANNIRVTGPYTWMRPYIHTASTGTYAFRLLGTR